MLVLVSPDCKYSDLKRIYSINMLDIDSIMYMRINKEGQYLCQRKKEVYFITTTFMMESC